MKFRFASSSVKGLRPEARETAQEAARRAGVPLSEWLNAVILQQAAQQGIDAAMRARSGADAYADDLSRVHMRLDDITQRIDQVSRSGAAAYAPKRRRDDTDQIADLIARFENRLDQVSNTSRTADTTVQLPPALDRAIAEITARRRALSGQTAPARTENFAPPAPTPPAGADLSGLESQLRRITDQIETLRRPGVEEAINALRAELAAIGRTLNEAMPRRAIETIERQIQELSSRIAEGREAGVDSGALAGIERGLGEVRDAVRGLMPAETLVGYNEAIAALARKIDLIVAQKDPATLQRLEASIVSLREMAAHVASNETMSALSGQVKTLGDKVDELAAERSASEALINLENRIDAIGRAIADRGSGGDALPSRLEGLVQSLSAKIDQIQQSPGDQVAFGHLEDRIVKLVERLDASDARLGHLEAVERGLADLLVHIEDLRANKQAAAAPVENLPAIATLKQDISRTQDTVEAMHGTLGNVVDRLTVIEQGVRSDRQQPAPGTDIVDIIQTVRGSPLSDTAASPPRATNSLTQTAADQPLEPGSGPPRSPSARIAASEAALGGVVRPAAATPTGKSDFIAAARRAAQAAGPDPKSRKPSAEVLKLPTGDGSSLRSKVATRMKSLFLAASIVAIIVGSFQFAGNVFNFGFFEASDTTASKSVGIEPENADVTATATETPTSKGSDEQSAPSASANTVPPITAADAAALAKLFAPPAPPPPPTLPSLTPASPPPAIQAPLNINPAAQGPSAASSEPNVPTVAPKNDVTGSVARTPAETKSSRQPAPIQPPAAQPVPGGLPTGIGSARLRNAAQAGDAGAAYEVAMRFAEGRGVAASLEEAARWFERAAGKGLTPAQFRYASMLEKGQGVKKDLAAAQRLYVAAAGKGHAKAMHNLAVLYAEGADGKPDYTTAAQWFRKAAEHGVADSQYNLGVLAARGLGTNKDLAEAYKWFALAAAQNDRDAGRKRDEVAGHLDARTLATAEQAVKNFVAEGQPPEAISIPEPPGGWDRAAPLPANSERPKSASVPLSINAFQLGKL